MGQSLIGPLLLQLILILSNAFFACAEIAVISVNDSKLEQLALQGDRRAQALSGLTRQPARFLATIQVAITLSGFLGAAFGTENFSGYLADFLVDVGLPLSPGVAGVIAMVVVTIIISFFSIAFGEMVPKRIAMQKPEMWAKMALGIVKAISLVFAPMMWLLDVTTNGTLKLLGMKTNADEGAASEEDIRLMVENSGEQGAIAQEEQQWIENVFDFGDMVASDVMTPEPDVTAFSLDESAEDIIQAIQETGLSRYPVYEEDINDICGVLNARDFLLNLQAKNPKPIKGLLRRAYFVPESVHADQLFKDMQSQKHHFAIVVDEYGGTAGVVTMEDLLEEIVGNIYDEYDKKKDYIIPNPDGSWTISGRAELKDVEKVLDIDLPEREEFNTLSGLILNETEEIPKEGDQFEVTVDGLRIQVLKVVDRRIEETRVSLLPTEPPEEP